MLTVSRDTLNIIHLRIFVKSAPLHPRAGMLYNGSMNEFTRKIYDAVKRIPEGKVATYGQIAFLAGSPRAARVVGGALHRNPDPLKTPCHRVVFKDGSLCSSYVFGGEGVQRALLAGEGVAFLPNGRVDMESCLWDGVTVS